MSYRSLEVINSLMVDIGIDKKVFLSEQFCHKLVAILENSNKLYAQLSLETITNLLIRDVHVFRLFVRLGLLVKMWDCCEGSAPPEVLNKGQELVGHCVMRILQLPYTPDEAELIWNVVLLLLHGTSDVAIKKGFVCMKKLISHNFNVQITPEMINLFLMYSQTGTPAILDGMFSVLGESKLEGKEKLTNHLYSQGFFTNLFQRIVNGDDEITVYVFKFLSVCADTPDPSGPIIPLTLNIMRDGSLRAKEYALRFLLEIIDEFSSDFPVFLAGNGLLVLINDIFSSGAILEESMKLLSKVIQSLRAHDIDLHSVEGVDELRALLYSMIDNCDSIYEPLITPILSELETT